MSEFKDLEFKSHKLLPGVQAIIFFDNNYGASVVKAPWSYGGNKGLYELAVLRKRPDGYEITYDTPITDDVIGYCSETDITRLLNQIEILPAYKNESKERSYDTGDNQDLG